MNVAATTIIYADRIRFVALTAKVITVVFINAGVHRVKGVFVFVVFKTYTFFV